MYNLSTELIRGDSDVEKLTPRASQYTDVTGEEGEVCQIEMRPRGHAVLVRDVPVPEDAVVAPTRDRVHTLGDVLRDLRQDLRSVSQIPRGLRVHAQVAGVPRFRRSSAAGTSPFAL